MPITTQNYKCEKCDSNNKCDFVAKLVAKENRKPMFDVLVKVNSKMKTMKNNNKNYPPFTASLVGSSKRSMIYIKSQNDNEYDHDIQVMYLRKTNSIGSYNPKILKTDFMEVLKNVLESNYNSSYNWNLENSTRVITVKKSHDGSRLASFDIALIDASSNEHKILVYNKEEAEYIWNQIGNGNQAYSDAKDIKGEKLKELKKKYLRLKHNQKNMSKEDQNYKSSSSLFIEAVNNYKNEN